MATLLCTGGGGGRGTTSISTGAGRSAMDLSTPSVPYGGSCVAPAATCSTAAIEPTGLTARFPNTRASGVSALAPGRVITDPRTAPPPPWERWAACRCPRHRLPYVREMVQGTPPHLALVISV